MAGHLVRNNINQSFFDRLSYFIIIYLYTKNRGDVTSQWCKDSSSSISILVTGGGMCRKIYIKENLNLKLNRKEFKILIYRTKAVPTDKALGTQICRPSSIRSKSNTHRWYFKLWISFKPFYTIEIILIISGVNNYWQC